MQIANIWNKEEKLFTKLMQKKKFGKKILLEFAYVDPILLWKIQIAKIRFSLFSLSILVLGKSLGSSTYIPRNCIEITYF